MKSAASTYRQNTLYNSPSSKERRRPPEPSGEVGRVKARWRDEKQAAVEDIRRKKQEVERTIREEKARDLPQHNGRGDDYYDRWRKEELDKGQKRLADIDRRYERELEETARRKPRE
jgi:hypothetical protein